MSLNPDFDIDIPIRTLTLIFEFSYGTPFSYIGLMSFSILASFVLD